jgi:glucosamine kinase
VSGRQAKAPLFLGIDGGGSGCRVRLCDGTGKILGEGEAGSANTLLGLPTVFDEITTATHRALGQAGLSADLIGRLHAAAGLAGLSLARERQKLTAFSHPFASFHAEADAHAACLGAHVGADGGIVIAGTGSCGLAMVAGQVHTVGGWGFAISDQGSGAALGRAALRQALCEQDGIFTNSRKTCSYGRKPQRPVATPILPGGCLSVRGQVTRGQGRCYGKQRQISRN